LTYVLVTGGAGYIGSHTCKQLASAGYTPVTFDNLSRGHRDLVKWGPLEEGELSDSSRLQEVFSKYKFEAVLHFAAFAYVGESMTEPQLYLDNNVHNGTILLDACRINGVRSIVVSSTCAVYGQPDILPISEDTETAPINIYGYSKLMLESAVQSYCSCYGMNAISLRYFNACGADPSLETGEDHDPEPHLIPRALMASAGRLPHLDVFGADFETPDGTCIRDYIHVSDLARAHVNALQRLLNLDNTHGNHEKFNLGSAKGYSVREIIDAASKVVGKEPVIKYQDRREGDPGELIADAALAREILGFKPEYTDLEEILQTAWAWMEKRSVERT
jgi:UDP-arabinose 4-epimerase